MMFFCSSVSQFLCALQSSAYDSIPGRRSWLAFSFLKTSNIEGKGKPASLFLFFENKMQTDET
jgi:hypothetical protein